MILSCWRVLRIQGVRENIRVVYISPQKKDASCEDWQQPKCGNSDSMWYNTEHSLGTGIFLHVREWNILDSIIWPYHIFCWWSTSTVFWKNVDRNEWTPEKRCRNGSTINSCLWFSKKKTCYSPFGSYKSSLQ